ncbi:hypothetical protein GS897_25610 [Rhodococcus hoagii]|nr:hypothetical protein [Prescottella equi]
MTLPLQALRRPITAIEIDPRHVQKLQHRVDPSTTVVHGDFLRYRLPRTPHTIVGNLPFHHTTAMLRRILHANTGQRRSCSCSGRLHVVVRRSVAQR